MKHENLTGTGTLYDGDRLVARVRYDVDVSWPESPLDPLGHSSGTLTLAQNPDAPFPFFNETGSNSLYVRLQDGRRWNCVLKDSEGTALGNGPIES